MEMKIKILKALLSAVLATFMLTSVLCACGAPAPAGMYDPVDGDKYKTGVENAIFAVPSEYTVTMSSNMLAAKGNRDSFSLQCRHSDYYYGDLYKNYRELKKELVGLYGEYEETFREDVQVAGTNALEVRYDLTVAGEEYSYVQYFFYFKNSRFFLFTYCAPKNEIDEKLLSDVLNTLCLEKQNYTVPNGYRAVENAQADSLLSNRYSLYCPDKWIFDFSLGQICMRVPSKTILSNVTFNEIAVGQSFEGYVSNYAARVAPGLEVDSLAPLEGYMVASLYQMYGVLKDFSVVSVETKDSSEGKETEKEEGDKEQKITADTLLTDKNRYLQTYTNKEGLTFLYVEFTANLPDHAAHGSGGLFVDSQSGQENEKDDQTVLTDYRFRQYFIFENGYLYIFTYTATESRFKEQYEDAFKVIQNFSFTDTEEN